MRKKNGNKIYRYTLSCNDITVMMIGPDVLHEMNPAWKLFCTLLGGETNSSKNLLRFHLKVESQCETCVTRMTQTVRRLAMCAGGCEFKSCQIHECYPSQLVLLMQPWAIRTIVSSNPSTFSF